MQKVLNKREKLKNGIITFKDEDKGKNNYYKKVLNLGD